MKYRIKKLGLLFISLILMTTYLLAMTPHSVPTNNIVSQWSTNIDTPSK